MCGICGVLNLDRTSPVDPATLKAMREVMIHRGPDDCGMYVNGPVGLGHRRLSIIDLESGHQPMANEDGTVWIVYNGEIYNHNELRAELTRKGHRFRTLCDTEAILHAYEEHGPQCVERLNGMFAFALWDSKKGQVFLARDRLGIKPLYYTVVDGTFLFGSEIKALLQHPKVHAEVEVNSVPEYLFCTALLEDHTMFRNIRSLQPAHTMVVGPSVSPPNRYWDLPLYSEPREMPRSVHEKEIKQLLDDSVRLRLMSDVPFGSLLSGGLDSSLVSALATRHVEHKLQTFSIEYTKNIEMNAGGSDTTYARLMAEQFATDHREFVVSPQSYYDLHEKVTWHLEKPVELTTPSLFLLHRGLTDFVTVVLSGEGADELFGGYFFFLEEAKKSRLSEYPWAPFFKEVSSLLDPTLAEETAFSSRVRASLEDHLNHYQSSDFLNRVLCLFLKSYLLEMLERQDKTSMAWGVETRVPFLDHRLVEYVVNIPSHYKLAGEDEKHILKESFRGFLPDAVIGRKKKPFPFPVDPRSVLEQRNRAIDLVQSGNSRIGDYFHKRRTLDFLRKRGEYQGMDSLAVFRTSYAILALEMWHQAFGI